MNLHVIGKANELLRQSVKGQLSEVMGHEPTEHDIDLYINDMTRSEFLNKLVELELEYAASFII